MIKVMLLIDIKPIFQTEYIKVFSSVMFTIKYFFRYPIFMGSLLLHRVFYPVLRVVCNDCCFEAVTPVLLTQNA